MCLRFLWSRSTWRLDRGLHQHIHRVSTDELPIAASSGAVLFVDELLANDQDACALLQLVLVVGMPTLGRAELDVEPGHPGPDIVSDAV
ncbi:MAG: hypothetical protein BGP10_04410 [Rhodanobacter sp. 68-29]|nr:MAG: hypothetical protein BGP10_04410 [Rhodanobacter sp. 68-29]